MNLYSKLTNFYQNCPHIWGKLTSFVTVLAKNTCLCGDRPALHWSKVSISILERFMKPGMGIIHEFLVQPHYFHIKPGPRFGWKMTSFVAILAKNTYVCGYRPVLYYFNVNIGLLERFMKPGMGIIDKFLLQPCHFLPSQSQFWREIDKFCGCSGPKDMCAWLQTGTLPLELQY